MNRARALLALLLLAACAPKPTEPTSDVVPLLDPDHRFYDAPFPASFRQRDDGTLDVHDFNPRGNALAKRYVDALNLRGEGFGRSAGFWFPLSGAIDPQSLPTPDTSTSFDSAVYLVNVDEASPSRGTFIPVELQFKAAAESYSPANLLVGLPVQGHVLEPATWYAAVLTRALKDPSGLRLPRAGGLDAKDPGPHLQQWRTDLGRLERLLTEQGRDPREVIAATTWRTGSHRERMRAISTAARAEPAVAAVAPVKLRDEATFSVVEVQVDVPMYQHGDKPYTDDGAIDFDASGAPVRQGTDRVKLILSVPRRPMPAAGFPIVFHVPGSGGDRFSMVDRGGPGNGLAKELSPHGLATFCMDPNLTGDRSPTGDTSGFSFLDPTTPLSFRDNTRQQVAEYEVYVRLVQGLRLPGAQYPDTQAAEVRFDAQSFFLHGHSTGSVVGASIMAVNSAFAAGVVSGAGGSWLYNLVLKQTPASAELVKLLLGYQDGDEVDVFDPVLHLASTLWDPTEPMNQAPLWSRDTSLRSAPASMLVIEGVTDTYYLPKMVAALATAAQLDVVGPTVEPLLVAGVTSVGGAQKPAPVSGNRAVGATAVTQAIAQYAAAPGHNGHFVVFDQPPVQYQYVCFFESAIGGRTAAVVAPQPDPLAACP